MDQPAVEIQPAVGAPCKSKGEGKILGLFFRKSYRGEKPCEHIRFLMAAGKKNGLRFFKSMIFRHNKKFRLLSASGAQNPMK